MDLVIAIIVMAVIGGFRVASTDGTKIDTPYLNETGDIVYPEGSDSRPLGSNLELLYEVDAYTYYVKELGLR